ncbi:hypothetical protein BGZ54_003675 [Gamsiella multidivaricata]|nr:hypothetical protein BGZ54_003675 [Gamsiella multidivaricata]
MNNNEENRAHMEDDEDEGDEDYQYEEAAEDDDDGEEDEDEDEDGDDDDGEDIEVDIYDYAEEDDNDESHDEDDIFMDEDEDDDGDGTTTIDLADLLGDGEGQPTRIHQLVEIMRALQGRSRMSTVRRPPRTPSPIPEPDREKGIELLNSGEFGRVDSAYIPAKDFKKKSIARRLWMRELKPRSINPLGLGESILPDNPGRVIDVYNAAAYSGQYSEDGSLFATCDRDFQLRIYKTAGNKLIRERVIQGMPGRWTITDHNLSLDNHWLIYSSITPYVYLTRTAADAPATHHQLDFSTDEDGEGLWSVRFSGDGREIVAGGRGRIYVYDIESRTVLHSVEAHNGDVNAVCFAEPSSSQVLFSGSDDRLVKVWDRRSMSAGRYSTPSGVLVGHSEGITYVTSKGDNRYLASNGKDQKMLLWDLRMMHSRREYAELPKPKNTGFDYRTDRYTGRRSYKVPGDCSVMAFQGHKVLKTLIRCHFSPAHTTGQRYLYTGSSDGKVAIYRLDGTLVRTLDTRKAFQRYLKADQPSDYAARDVSWHPYYPTIVSSCVADYYAFTDTPGGIVQHSFTQAGDLESDMSEEETLPPPPPLRQRQRRTFLF